MLVNCLLSLYFKENEGKSNKENEKNEKTQKGLFVHIPKSVENIAHCFKLRSRLILLSIKGIRYNERVKQKHWQIILLIACCAVICYTFFSVIKIVTSLAPDFSVYFSAARDLFIGLPIYTDTHVFTSFGYPPITAFFYIFFLLFPYSISQTLFITGSFIAACVSLLISYKLIKIPFTILTISLGLLLLFLAFPTKFTLGMGQSNFFALMILLDSFLCYIRKKTLFSAILFAIAIILKPIFLFLILFFILEKQWNILFRTLAFIVGLVIVMTFLFPNSLYDTFYYIKHMLPSLFNIHGRGVYYNQGLTGFVVREIGETVLAKHLATFFSLVIAFCGLFTLNKSSTIQKIVILLTLLPLIDSLSWQHHFVVLLLPFAYVISTLLKKQDIVGLSMVGISYILVCVNIANPQTFSYFPLNILLSHTFYGTLVLLGVEMYIIFPLQKRKLLGGKLSNRLLVGWIHNK